MNEPPFRHKTLIDLGKLFIVNDGRGRKLQSGASAELLAYIMGRLQVIGAERVGI